MISNPDLEAMRKVVSGDDCTLPFGALQRSRGAAERALLHAGIEFIEPEWERLAMVMSARKYDVEAIAFVASLQPMEVDKALQRVARTLVTWERNACRWSTRYCAVEPMSEDGRHWRPGDGKQGTRTDSDV